MSRKERKPISKGERAWRITFITLGALFLWCILTYLITPLFITRPHRNREAEEILESRTDVQDVTVYGRNELSGYLIDDPASDTLLIYFYGILDDAASCTLDFLDMKAEGSYQNIDIAVVDWPAYGTSKGICSAQSMREAACSIVDAFAAGDPADGYSCSEIVIMGYSLGTGPAVYAAAECGCSDLILISPYYSSADLYNQVTPIFYGPLNSLLGFKMETAEYAGNVNVKPLIIASDDDRRVPAESSLRLAECFPAGCDVLMLQSADHGTIPSASETLDWIDQRLLP